VKFWDHGVDSFSVSDNGHGILQSDSELIGKRSCTSKLKEFEDLGQLNSFGFRGEALHSLVIAAKS
jgi:DNA mismatch repair protein PMS2